MAGEWCGFTEVLRSFLHLRWASTPAQTWPNGQAIPRSALRETSPTGAANGDVVTLTFSTPHAYGHTLIRNVFNKAGYFWLTPLVLRVTTLLDEPIEKVAALLRNYITRTEKGARPSPTRKGGRLISVRGRDGTICPVCPLPTVSGGWGTAVVSAHGVAPPPTTRSICIRGLHP